MVKLTAQGVKQWDVTLGGRNYEDLRDVIQTLDGGYALAGSSYSDVSGDKTQPSKGMADRWIVKLDMQGIKQWDLGLGGVSFEDSNTILQNIDGSYVVLGSSESGISGDKSEPSRGSYDYWLTKLVPVVATPVTIAGDSVLCMGSRVQLTATGGLNAHYAWNTGATTASIFVSQGGTYTVQATYPTGLKASAAFHVVARPLIPNFSLGADTILCVGQQTLLRGPIPASPGAIYRWSDGSTGTELLVQQAGTYQLTISGCNSQTATRQISVAVCPVTIPNVITPNGDHYNDNFVIKGLPAGQWSLTIYNRWGAQVYRTENYQAEWGETAASGIYYYQLHQLSNTTVYKGWVEVIK
ncbi:gliding motility-associated C-terminal domain-containing protein (plasmid) [Hymenobacter sp. BRD128]|uniref:gliding motility-associated C-terminal domain-containing protein n=1 Tax=Hymenobacter sp. BRD128 TaxID=2675878 RepID=UPI001565641F|nr:gliding motility-associated C-terminal domain-containing protein [Hymenobacter sp. BRD128]QKG59213.1 gliding motility-associated C-terminal domain-containing protein [Hymenobacter sp. BRD128]